MRRLLSVALVLLDFLSAHGQVLTQSRTDVYYDAATNRVYQISSGSIDFNTEYWYSLQMASYLRQNGFTAGFGSGNTNGTSYVTTYAEAPASSGAVFDVINWVDLIIAHQTYEVVYGCWDCYDWYDPYNYSILARDGDPIDTGITFSVWVWAAPIMVVRTLWQQIQLGNTGGSGNGIPGPRNVFYLKVKAFIRPSYVFGPDTCSTGGFVVKSTVYKGDGRGFDPYSFNYRAMSSIMLSAGGYILPGTTYHDTGLSEQYASDGLVNGVLTPDPVLDDCYKLNRRRRASNSDMHVAVSGPPPL
jgi:hypothetical protein